MPTWLAETTRRLLDWLRQEPDDPLAGLWFSGREAPPEPEADGVERPWRHRWDHLPKRSAGFGFSRRDYQAARERDEEIARLTLGDEVCTPDSSRFWPADSYEVGRGQPSFDKQYVRDWATSTGWDKSPPAPPIPDDVVAQTRERYVTTYERLAGEPFGAWLDRTA